MSPGRAPASSVLTVADKRTLISQGLTPRCPQHPAYAGDSPSKGPCESCHALRRAIVARKHEGA